MIEYIKSPSGGWFVIKQNGRVIFSGDDIPDYYWLEILDSFNIRVDEKEISDEDMEEGNY